MPRRILIWCRLSTCQDCTRARVEGRVNPNSKWNLQNLSNSTKGVSFIGIEVKKLAKGWGTDTKDFEIF